MKYLIETIDWQPALSFVLTYLPFLLAFIFLAVHVADRLGDRRFARSLRARAAALRHGERETSPVPHRAYPTNPIRYIQQVGRAKRGKSAKDVLMEGLSLPECEHGTDFAFECEACDARE